MWPTYTGKIIYIIHNWTEICFKRKQQSAKRSQIIQNIFGPNSRINSTNTIILITLIHNSAHLSLFCWIERFNSETWKHYWCGIRQRVSVDYSNAAHVCVVVKGSRWWTGVWWAVRERRRQQCPACAGLWGLQCWRCSWPSRIQSAWSNNIQTNL